MEAVLNDDFMNELRKRENPYASTHKQNQSKHGYITVMTDSIRVSSKAAAEALCEAGYASWDNCRQYQNDNGQFKVDDNGIEYQFYTNSKTYDKNKTTNKNYKGTSNEEIKKSSNFYCRSKTTWVRYQIIWVLENGDVKFYVQASKKSEGDDSDAVTSEKLVTLCGVPAYTKSDIWICT